MAKGCFEELQVNPHSGRREIRKLRKVLVRLYITDDVELALHQILLSVWRGANCWESLAPGLVCKIMHSIRKLQILTGVIEFTSARDSNSSALRV